MALATLENLKSYLGVPNAAADAELGRLLSMAETAAEQYAERSFLSAARVERRSGNGRDLLMVRDAPITAVSALSFAGTAVAASNGTTPGYLFDGASLYLVGGLCFPCGRKNILINYTGGFATVPADVSHAVIEIAAQAYREKEWIGMQSKSLAGETVSYLRNELPDSAKTVLDIYRRTYSCD